MPTLIQKDHFRLKMFGVGLVSSDLVNVSFLCVYGSAYDYEYKENMLSKTLVYIA